MITALFGLVVLMYMAFVVIAVFAGLLQYAAFFVLGAILIGILHSVVPVIADITSSLFASFPEVHSVIVTIFDGMAYVVVFSLIAYVVFSAMIPAQKEEV